MGDGEAGAAEFARRSSALVASLAATTALAPDDIEPAVHSAAASALATRLSERVTGALVEDAEGSRVQSPLPLSVIRIAVTTGR